VTWSGVVVHTIVNFFLNVILETEREREKKGGGRQNEVLAGGGNGERLEAWRERDNEMLYAGASK
jgi:hypothetical protein